MRVHRLSESESAPLASHWGVLVATVKLDILHRVSQGKFVDSSASGHVSVHLDNRQSVNQLLSVGLMSGHRFLELVYWCESYLLGTGFSASPRRRSGTW